MEISGTTKPFAVLGHPIAHTLSPAMHNAALLALEWDAVYLAFDVTPERVVPALAALGELGFRGVNLTVPLKEAAFRGLKHRDDSAALVRSVNTVAFHDAGPVGYSTDGEGFLRAHEEAFGGGIGGANIFVLGAGGAGRALALVCAVNGARAVTLADTDSGRAAAVAEEIRATAPTVHTTHVEGDAACIEAARTADLVLQATPVGMKPSDPSPLGAEAFRPGQQAFDLIYTAPETPFMKTAAAAGAHTANGLAMLLYQGVRSFEIWTGVTPPVEIMRETLRKAVYG